MLDADIRQIASTGVFKNGRPPVGHIILHKNMINLIAKRVVLHCWTKVLSLLPRNERSIRVVHLCIFPGGLSLMSTMFPKSFSFPALCARNLMVLQKNGPIPKENKCKEVVAFDRGGKSER